MFKKLLSAAALALFSMGAFANPGDVIEDYVIDFTTMTEFPFYVMGYTPTFDGAMISSNPMSETDENGNPAPAWYQYFVADGIPTTPGLTYKVVAKVKASEEVSFNLNMGWGWGDGQQIGKQIAVPTDWAEVELEYPEVGGSSCNLVAQPGVSQATIYWQYIKVYHIDNQAPIEWVDILTNGDAEGEYGEVACCYAKSNIGEDAGNPVPAEIVEIDGGHAFICRAGAVDASADGHQWANQLWIVAPQNFTSGEQIKVSFRYKSSVDAGSVPSQAHADPGDYIHWQMIGNINFTTEWQTISKTVTLEDAHAGGGRMHSIAFNLNETMKDACDFYFDDIKWEVTPTEDGWFVAGDFQEGGKENLGEAVAMAYDEEIGIYYTTVGTAELPASVIKVSAKKGNDNAFNANTISVDIPEDYNYNEDENYLEYKKAAAKKINLPVPGAWDIKVDPEYVMIALKLNGEGGISSVEFDANAPIEVYNLQGVKVNNPVRGNVYILKQGNKVAKTIVR